MKRFFRGLVSLSLVLIFFTSVNYASPRVQRLTSYLNEAWEGITLPFRMAQLRAKAPDAVLIMPVAGVLVGQVTDTWGAPRSGGRKHEGQDIFAPRGTPIYSATEGYALSIGEGGLGGKKVFILGAGGRRYYYAHLDAFSETLEPNDYVTPETVLGYVGDSGNAKGTPPHLHFGVYTASGATNPLPLLIDRNVLTEK